MPRCWGGSGVSILLAEAHVKESRQLRDKCSHETGTMEEDAASYGSILTRLCRNIFQSLLDCVW